MTQLRRVHYLAWGSDHALCLHTFDIGRVFLVSMDVAKVTCANCREVIERLKRRGAKLEGKR